MGWCLGAEGGGRVVDIFSERNYNMKNMVFNQLVRLSNIVSLAASSSVSRHATLLRDETQNGCERARFPGVITRKSCTYSVT